MEATVTNAYGYCFWLRRASINSLNLLNSDLFKSVFSSCLSTLSFSHCTIANICWSDSDYGRSISNFIRTMSTSLSSLKNRDNLKLKSVILPFLAPFSFCQYLHSSLSHCYHHHTACVHLLCSAEISVTTTSRQLISFLRTLFPNSSWSFQYWLIDFDIRGNPSFLTSSREPSTALLISSLQLLTTHCS